MFNNNPYRFLGVVSNAGAKAIQKNLSKIKAYSKIITMNQFTLIGWRVYTWLLKTGN